MRDEASDIVESLVLNVDISEWIQIKNQGVWFRLEGMRISSKNPFDNFLFCIVCGEFFYSPQTIVGAYIVRMGCFYRKI